ncbi:hypothetical protein FraQA3DRAFT_4538 [Frankia sp. QA3]|nr:hypothetical protein FraQA3DRAFT_4538 [Frankia sp. QA3]
MTDQDDLDVQPDGRPRADRTARLRASRLGRARVLTWAPYLIALAPPSVEALNVVPLDSWPFALVAALLSAAGGLSGAQARQPESPRADAKPTPTRRSDAAGS